MRAFWLKRILSGNREGSGNTPGALRIEVLHHSEHSHRVDLPLHHLVNTADATKLLMGHFHCDDWHVACRTEHLQVIRLTRQGIPQYAVSYRCTPDVEKAVFHASKTWAVSVIPLHSKDELSPQEIRDVKAVLEQASAAEPTQQPTPGQM